MLQAWSQDGNIVRRIVDIERERINQLDLLAKTFGRGRSSWHSSIERDKATALIVQLGISSFENYFGGCWRASAQTMRSGTSARP